MADAVLELQGAIRAALVDASPAIVGGGIYDRVPEDAVFPYVSFGPVDAAEDDAECIDAVEIAFQIDVWSRAVGFPEASGIAAQVRAALHNAELTLSANALVSIEHRQSRRFRDPDGITSHVAMTFIAIVETT
jgi:hypothetical protein